MSITQNITLSDTSWFEIPETEVALTIECSDSKAFLFWTDGGAVPSGARGHYLKEPKVVSIVAGEKLWVSAQDGSATIVYTVE